MASKPRAPARRNRGIELLPERERPTGVAGGHCGRPGGTSHGRSTWNTLLAEEGTSTTGVPRETSPDRARPPARRRRCYRCRPMDLPAGVAACCGR
jgi:hypothetical protein